MLSFAGSVWIRFELDIFIFHALCKYKLVTMNKLFKEEFRVARICKIIVFSGNPAPQEEDFQDDVTEDFEENNNVVEAESEPAESEKDELEPAESEEADSEITEDAKEEEEDLDNGGRFDLKNESLVIAAKRTRNSNQMKRCDTWIAESFQNSLSLVLPTHY